MNFLLEAFRAVNRGDEFYTRYNDVAKELCHYDLSGMIVYCNCDNPDTSNLDKRNTHTTEYIFTLKKISKLIAPFTVV